jgi:dynein heavy chain
LNMPYVDTYGTQSPIALIRQQMDYKLWYDTNESDPNRKKKIIHDCQYLAAMNNKAGSFTVNQRLMAHFATFSCSTPSRDQLFTIYRSILDGHLLNFNDKDIIKQSKNICNATIDLLETMSKSPKFKPSSTKFHYSFTMRDISNVFQGLVTSKPSTLTEMEFIRLWFHECTRVFGDRLIDQNDVDAFNDVLKQLSKKNFADLDQDKVTEEPLLFGSFIHKEKAYTPITNYSDLKASLETYLADYNENNAELPLVLFEMAMNHVVRIARIIANPKGNAFLIGVGGSGKQSLTRLASWICGYEVFQIAVTRLYSSADLLEDIKALYMKCGVKGQGMTFMLTDSQIVDEKWLVYINDLLSSGDIPGLFAEDEKESIYSSLRQEFKLNNIEDSNRSAMHEYFINKVSKNLHLVLCFSPVGEAFRVRCRKFPALINCTSLDWFFSWPYDALTSVAHRFIGESEELSDILSDEQRDKISHHMAHCHVSVNSMSTKYFQVEKRYNYTTPKSFLELIYL